MNIKIMAIMQFLVLISLSCFAKTNKEFYFKLNWKTGEEKVISITKNLKEFKDGKVKQDTAKFTVNKITVTQINDSAIFINYRIENELIKYGSLMYENLKNELEKYTYITLNYRINKSTLKSEFLNLDKANSSVDDSYREVTKILKNKVPEKFLKAESSIDNIYKEMKGFEVESESLTTILYSYNKKFILGDTLTTMDTSSNPFKLEKFIGAKVKSNISEIGKTVYIKVDKTYDFAAYKSMINKMSVKVGDVIPTNKNATNQLSAIMISMLNSFDFGASESMLISKKLDSSWPLEITQQVFLSIKNANSESSGIINQKIEIK